MLNLLKTRWANMPDNPQGYKPFLATGSDLVKEIE